MKKRIFTFLSFILFAQLAFAGGIVTNTNQSASWVRMMARDASVDVDAVFFNPAGLTHLEDGFYIQVNSQTIKQTRTVSSTFPGLNTSSYEGLTSVPFLPTAFLVYKKGNLAFSGGLTIIGGGGSADFDKGLPDLEYNYAKLTNSLKGIKAVAESAGLDGAPLEVSGYKVDANISGSSAYYGFQGAVSYKINDMISVALGARYVLAKNKYTGELNNFSLLAPGGEMDPATFITGRAVPTLTGISNQLKQVVGVPNLIEPYLAQAGGFTLESLKPSLDAQDPTLYPNLIRAGQVAGIADPAKATVQQLYDGIIAATPELNGKIEQLDQNAAALTAASTQLGDKKLDVEQSGSGITPFVSVDIDLGSLGLSAKYEMKTNMKVKTTVIKDDFSSPNKVLFTNDEEVPAEMPAMLALGARYNAGALKLQTGFHYYLDKAAKYGKKNAAEEFVTNGEETTFTGSTDKTLLEGNSMEFAVGVQYDINSMFGLSAGFLMTKTNPNSVYQSALSYSLSTKTFGFGGIVHATSHLDFDLGVSFTSYDEYKKEFTGFSETYDKTAFIFALGASYRL